jgi:ABC-type Zn uptake system ZnuABC Zn-binding protein ZnuA
VLITAHDAFGYFGQQYGMEVRGLQGTSTATEASASDVQALSTFIADRKIKAIFVESSVPKATIEAVQAAVRSSGWTSRSAASSSPMRWATTARRGDLHRDGPALISTRS